MHRHMHEEQGDDDRGFFDAMENPHEPVTGDATATGALDDVVVDAKIAAMAPVVRHVADANVYLEVGFFMVFLACHLLPAPYGSFVIRWGLVFTLAFGLGVLDPAYPIAIACVHVPAAARKCANAVTVAGGFVLSPFAAMIDAYRAM